MSSKRTWLVLAAVLAAAVVGYFTWRNSPKLAPQIMGSGQAASAIRAVVKKDIRFLDVSINTRSDATIVIVAPAKLPAEAKAALEQIIKKNAPRQKTNIMYVIQIESGEH